MKDDSHTSCCRLKSRQYFADLEKCIWLKCGIHICIVWSTRMICSEFGCINPCDKREYWYRAVRNNSFILCTTLLLPAVRVPLLGSGVDAGIYHDTGISYNDELIVSFFACNTSQTSTFSRLLSTLPHPKNHNRLYHLQTPPPAGNMDRYCFYTLHLRSIRAFLGGVYLAWEYHLCVCELVSGLGWGFREGGGVGDGGLGRRMRCGGEGMRKRVSGIFCGDWTLWCLGVWCVIRKRMVSP